MKPLAMMIHRAEMLPAKKTSQAQRQCSFLPIFFQPKCQTAMKVDSRKKATVASMARSEPKMSPTNSE